MMLLFYKCAFCVLLGIPRILGSRFSASLFTVATPDFERGEVKLLAPPNGVVGNLFAVLFIFRCYLDIPPRPAQKPWVFLDARLTITHIR